MVTAYPSLPPTSAAVNIQIVEPKNFAGGATAGSLGPSGQPSYQPHQGGAPSPYGYGPQQGGYGPQPNGYQNPQQQLQQAYTDAMNARNAAEQARNNYMSLANNLNNQAYNQVQPYLQPQPQPYFQQQPQQAPYNQSINIPPSPYPQPMPYPYPFQMGPVQGPQPYPQPYPVQPQPIDMSQVPQPQPEPVQQQPQPEPAKMEELRPEPPKPELPKEPVNPYKSANIDDLNMMVANPTTLQEKINAMEEIGVRGQGSPQTYELLKREALADTAQLSGQALDDANYIRQAALWTMGMLNKAQNSSVPTDKLPGLATIEKILADKKANPEVQAAAVQALQVIDRPNDKRIQKILKAAAKNKNPDVKRLAGEALAGKTIPLPTQQSNLMYMA